MRKRYLLISVILSLVIYSLYFTNYAYKKYEKIAPAECPVCLCVNAPDCVDVSVLVRGFPLRTREELINRAYVRAPYKDDIIDNWIYSNIIIQSIAILFVATIIYKVYEKYENSRN